MADNNDQFDAPPQFDTRPGYMQASATATGPVSPALRAATGMKKPTFKDRMLQALRQQVQTPFAGTPMGGVMGAVADPSLTAAQSLGFLGGSLGKLAQLAFMADGGVRPPWQAAVMGEEGPELVVNADGSSRIVGNRGPEMVIPLTERPPRVEGAGGWQDWDMTPQQPKPMPAPAVRPVSAASPDIPAPPPVPMSAPTLPQAAMRSPLPAVPAYPTNQRDAYAAHQKAMPTLQKPALLNRIAAAALGAGTGWVNGAGRTQIPWQQVASAQQGILHPGYGRAMENWQTQNEGLRTAAQLEGQAADDARRSLVAEKQMQTEEAQAEAARATARYRDNQIANAGKQKVTAPKVSTEKMGVGGKEAYVLKIETVDPQTGVPTIKHLTMDGRPIDPSELAPVEKKDTPEALNRQQDADILQAAADKLGKRVEDLTASERTAARNEAVMARRAKKAGKTEGSGDTSLVDAVMANPNLYNDLTPTVKGRIGAELQKRGFEFGKPLSDSAVQKLSETQAAISSLKDLRDVLKANERYIGPIAGLQALNPYSEARKAQADIDRVKQRVGKALEGGVLRKEDEEKYKKILATLSDTPATAIYKIDQIMSEIQRDHDTYAETQKQAGRKVPKGTEQKKSDPLGVR